jgi:hypothetical protein
MDSYPTQRDRLQLRRTGETRNGRGCVQCGTRRGWPIGITPEISKVRLAILFAFEADEMRKGAHFPSFLGYESKLL